MNKKIKFYKMLFAILVSSSLSSSDGSQILYSINMPGNPFQQPYYQMMIKADNKNSVYTFSPTNQPLMYTFYACQYENYCGSGFKPKMMVASDYVSLYADTQGDGSHHISLMYGLSPYVFRGYVEGSASTLSMQRPAQVQLPFNPLVQIQSQNGLTVPSVNATLPDYSDVFLAQTTANVYQSLKCTDATCTLSPSSNVQMPSWYTYIPRTVTVGNNAYLRGSSVIFYGTVTSLSKPQQQTTFSPYSEPINWGSLITLGVSKMSSTVNFPGKYTPQIMKDGVFAQSSFVGYNSNKYFQQLPVSDGYLVFAPVISPGYAGDSQEFSHVNGYTKNVDPLQSVLAMGDLTGNYSVSNLNFPYIPSTDSATTYDGVALPNGMSYFQLFAQNMQWFSQQTTINPIDYPLPSLSSKTLQNVTPGQGIFSDAIQLAAMEAPAATSKVPVFTGSLGVTAGITGPVMLTGAAPVTGGAPITFVVPQAFLSELTVSSFKVGRYLQSPLATQMSGTWSGGLVQAASEDPLQYYQGVTQLSSLMPYLPVYLSDPGRLLDKEFKPGWNHCPLSMFNGSQPMCYSTATSPMANFFSALNGTR